MSKGKHNEQVPIELFATAGGIHAIDSPVLVNILSMLKGCEMPFDEIVERSGKAKSTISVHLNRLIAEGVIGSRLDSLDRRKKIFFINSSYLGGLQKDQGIDEDIKEYVSRAKDGVPDISDFYRLMFRTIRVELYRQGVNIEPILGDAGYKVGQALYETVGSDDLDELLGNVAKFWSSHQLGRMVVAARDPLTLHVYDCFECYDLPQLGRPACAFDTGILRAILISHLGKDPGVKETECYTMGNDRCSFVIGVQ
jgi:uncharacterized protein